VARRTGFFSSPRIKRCGKPRAAPKTDCAHEKPVSPLSSADERKGNVETAIAFRSDRKKCIDRVRLAAPAFLHRRE
jgi:hypothetical protein